MTAPISIYQRLHKLLIAIIYFTLASCGNERDGAAKIIHAPSVDSVPARNTVAKKVDYTVDFSANAVTEVGKAINCIYQDVNDNYWFASNGSGVYCYDGKTLLQFTTKNGLNDNQVFTIQEDNHGNLWFLTAGGISCFNGKAFTAFPDKSNKQLLSDKGISMEPDDMWFEVGGGAYHSDSKTFTYVLLPASSLDARHFNPTNSSDPDLRMLNAYSVYCTLKDKKGNVWLGTQTLGVCRFDGKSFTWFTEKGLSGPAVRGLFEDSNGNLWFGNNGNGLFKYDGKSLINFTAEKGMSNPEFLKSGKSGPGTLARVWTINEDNNGNLWIGTYDAGVWRFDGENLTNYTSIDGLTSNAINTIYKDRKGELWFGTDGAGVCKFNGISFSGFAFNPEK
ncbi:MAG: hypothetical protein IPO83_14765 [Chitinophagaceae bacterium]|nr:hypothetical protein [Chitinophagaceae bacterium]